MIYHAIARRIAFTVALHTTPSSPLSISHTALSLPRLTDLIRFSGNKHNLNICIEHCGWIVWWSDVLRWCGSITLRLLCYSIISDFESHAHRCYKDSPFSLPHCSTFAFLFILNKCTFHWILFNGTSNHTAPTPGTFWPQHCRLSFELQCCTNEKQIFSRRPPNAFHKQPHPFFNLLFFLFCFFFGCHILHSSVTFTNHIYHLPFFYRTKRVYTDNLCL